MDVSIHAPAWGATGSGRHPAPSTHRFNPRPRVGGDTAIYHHIPIETHVSIHAPAWGATIGNQGLHLGRAVSIHAPAWGATKRKSKRRFLLQCFNPRPRVGGDGHGSGRRNCVDQVSIHAPAWGATPRSQSGRREVMFQSTPPRGGRHARALPHLVDHEVSIHAPAWGATAPFGHRYARNEVSIHAPAWGATRANQGVPGGGPRFNPRPRVGGDTVKFTNADGKRVVSIHAPAWGATRQDQKGFVLR